MSQTKKDRQSLTYCDRRELSSRKIGYRKYFVYPGDGKYIGEWKDNKHDGYGKKIQKNCLIYEGYWSNGKRNGHGIVRKRLENGLEQRIYIGEWKDDMKHGEGKKFFSNGIYFGYWQKDKRNGLGTFWYNDGRMYVGEWLNDVHSGAGVLFQKDRNRYEGFFNNGKKHGEGLYYHKVTGQVQKGIWENDVCKTSMIWDEFRNEANRPTPYPIPRNELDNPNRLIHENFRHYMPDIDNDLSDLKYQQIPCQEFVQKIKSKSFLLLRLFSADQQTIEYIKDLRYFVFNKKIL